MANTVETFRYIKVDLGANNNKFWHATLFDDNSVECHWGRVGDDGQRLTKSFGSDWSARSFIEKKTTEKEGKGYQLQQTLETNPTARSTQAVVAKAELASVAAAQIESNSTETAKLIAYLTEKNVHNILSATTMTYNQSAGTFSTPLGIVTKAALKQARAYLDQIGDIVVRQDWTNRALMQSTNEYLMLVPQSIGRRRLEPRDLFPDDTALQKQSALLDALEASLQEMLTAPPVVEESTRVIDQPRLFEVKLSLVEDGREIDRIRRKFRETAKSMHECRHLDVKTVYMIEIAHMQRAFQNDGAKLKNIWELWHGTRTGNLLSIMKGGFVIPPGHASHCTGRLFGNGVYFSDQSTKSLNYAYGYWSGGDRDENCFMLLNNVAMGNFYNPRSTGESLPKSGYDSTFAEGGKCSVMNNEMIVYRVSQIDPIFLVEFSPGGR